MTGRGFAHFARRVDEGAPSSELLALIHGERDPKVRRACVIHAAWIEREREVLTDDELRALAAEMPGKVARYLEAALLVRRLRRDPHDADAFARAVGLHAGFVDDFLATLPLTDAQRAALARRRASRGRAT